MTNITGNQFAKLDGHNCVNRSCAPGLPVGSFGLSCPRQFPLVHHRWQKGPAVGFSSCRAFSYGARHSPVTAAQTRTIPLIGARYWSMAR
jgi:hypothetical protein